MGKTSRCAMKEGPKSHMWHKPYAVANEPAHADAVGHGDRHCGDDEHNSRPRQVPRLRLKPRL